MRLQEVAGGAPVAPLDKKACVEAGAEGAQVRILCIAAVPAMGCSAACRAEAAHAQEGQAGKERKPRVPLSDEATLAQLASVQGGCCVCTLRCAPLCAVPADVVGSAC